MVTIGMNYQVLEGKTEAFEKTFASIAEALRSAPGHVDSRLYRQVMSSQNQYLIVSEWSDEGAFQTFIRSDAFGRVTRWGLQDVLAGRPSHHIYGAQEPLAGRA